MEAVIRAHHDQQPFSGVMQLRSGDHLICPTAMGEADRSAGLPDTVTTRFGTASGTKTFTAVAVP